MKTLTVRLEDDLHKQLKMYSVTEGITIQDLLVKLIKDTVEQEQDK